jgi:2-polyprenyl-3-methyl-5-hydroxy-6-metoxy-1,4-benzoquinol methylase
MSKNTCRVTGTPIIEFMDFGPQPLGNGFIDYGELDSEYFYDMKLGFSEESMLVQLINQPDPNRMFHQEYAFFSSTSENMKLHFKDLSDYVISSGILPKQNPFVVELGCNDGILLKNFAALGIKHLGIEPSKNVAQQANINGVNTVSEFFDEEVADKVVQEYGQADVFLAANVMCHISNIKSVVSGIKKLVKQRGIIIFEEPYLGDVIKKISYDQIYDEHVFVFSALSVQYLFNLFGIELIDVSHQNTHGGSMRYVLSNKGIYPVKDSVLKLINDEQRNGLDKLETFLNFRLNVEKSKQDLNSLILSLKSQGKDIAGYAATSKSTTILNYCGIGPDMISYICDTTPLKQGKLSPGVHIPIVPYENFSQNPPDYALLFAWNHSDEILSKEKDFSLQGGKWITHVPNVRIL